MNDKTRTEIMMNAITMFEDNTGKETIAEAISLLYSEIRKPDIKFITDSAVDMWMSLLVAIDKAGGATSCFPFNRVKDMTVLDLFSSLATNRVRFTVLDKG